MKTFVFSYSYYNSCTFNFADTTDLTGSSLGSGISALTASAGAAAAVNMEGDRSRVDRVRTFKSKHHHERHWGPFFEEPQLNSTAPGDNLVSAAHLYTEAVLNCRVGMLKDKTVGIWMSCCRVAHKGNKLCNKVWHKTTQYN